MKKILKIYFAHTPPGGAGVRHDVAADRFLRVCREHGGGTVHLRHHLIRYHHRHAVLNSVVWLFYYYFYCDYYFDRDCNYYCYFHYCQIIIIVLRFLVVGIIRFLI